jgi:hypothetical protein
MIVCVMVKRIRDSFGIRHTEEQKILDIRFSSREIDCRTTYSARDEKISKMSSRVSRDGVGSPQVTHSLSFIVVL